MPTIDKLESGCNSFISLYEHIINQIDIPKDTMDTIKYYYKEDYKEIKEMMEG